MGFFSFLGSPDFYILIAPLVYWCIDSRLGFRLAIYLTTSTGLNSLLKFIFHAPRPYWYDIRVRLLGNPEHQFGIPSGHGQNAVVIWGGVAASLKRQWAWIIAGILTFFIGVSRIYLGVHFPVDVYVGWGLGFILLLFFLSLEKMITAWFGKLSRLQKIGVAFIFSLIIIFSATIVRNISSNTFQIPEDWQINSALVSPDEPIGPFSLDDSVTAGAVLFGFILGVTLFFEKGWLDSKGPLHKRLFRFILGLIGVLILYRGLGDLFAGFAPTDSATAYILRYIRYSLIGFWVTGLGPWVFIKLGIGFREEK